MIHPAVFHSRRHFGTSKKLINCSKQTMYPLSFPHLGECVEIMMTKQKILNTILVSLRGIPHWEISKKLGTNQCNIVIPD